MHQSVRALRPLLAAFITLLLPLPGWAATGAPQGRYAVVIGANLGHLWHRTERMVGMIHKIADLAGQGILSPVIDSEFSFDQAAEAHAYIQARKNFGKVLLRP